jgi:hypothetical protein
MNAKNVPERCNGRKPMRTAAINFFNRLLS